VTGLYDTDIEGALNLEHQSIVTSALEENRAQSIRDCKERFEGNLVRDWEKVKKRIFEELGQHKGMMAASVSQSSGGSGVSTRNELAATRGATEAVSKGNFLLSLVHFLI
jgi:hypothetical protein